MINANNAFLVWECIYYKDEHDTDGSLLTSEWVDEAPYRGGFLIKSCFVRYLPNDEEQRCESITFIR